MSSRRTEIERFEESSRRRRLLREEELILEVSEVISEAMQRRGRNKSGLAKALGKSKGFVSQILAGNRNLTLRTIADIADALGCRIVFRLSPDLPDLSEFRQAIDLLDIPAWSGAQPEPKTTVLGLPDLTGAEVEDSIAS